MQLVSFASRRELLSHCSSVTLYGAGSIGRAAIKLLRQQGVAVRAVLDRRAAPGQQLEGVLVVVSASFEARAAAGDILVVVTILNRTADTADIRRALEDSGCHRALSFSAFYELFPDELGWRFWVAPRSHLAAHAGNVAALRDLLCDDRSRATLDALVAQRRSASLDFPVPEPLEQQYLAPDLPALADPRSYAHFVDCGAFDGDTVERMRDRFPEGALASCFEPDLQNFVKLGDRARAGLGGRPSHLLLWPCGVWDTTAQLHFSAGEGESSHVGAAGTTTIQTVALDDALAGAPPPTFIKLDVEGAETEALVGARRLIARSRPVLAVSVYHRPGHLWEIAELVAGWRLGYDFHLRTYGHQGFETVLYAIPRGVTS